MNADDVMERLASIQPLPRGERLANIAGVFKITEARRTLMLQWAWRTNALGSRSTVAAILWSVASRALNSENESVRNIARWRDYAAPLRKAREQRQYARACANVLSQEVERLTNLLTTYGDHKCSCPQRHSYTYACVCGWNEVRP